MKKHKLLIRGHLLVIPLFLMLVGCREPAQHSSVMGVLKEATAPVAQVEPESFYAGDDLELVLSTYEGVISFAEPRKDKIKRFPCSNCHGDDQIQQTNGRQIVHGNIQLNHGAVENSEACNTCHNMENRDFLISKSRGQIDFDHSYQLCGQCHFRQEKDWMGGAHGKRVSYWEGRRVIKNCTDCHNPHSPKFAKRWPATYSIPH